MFTKQKVLGFRSDFSKAVEALEKQYGCSIELGNIRYDDETISSKMTAKIGGKKVRASKSDFSVGDIVNIDHKKYTKGDKFEIVKINNKKIKVQTIVSNSDRIGGFINVSPGLLEKI
jgi:hypothetical protein